jgi:hypothetical protein
MRYSVTRPRGGQAPGNESGVVTPAAASSEAPKSVAPAASKAPRATKPAVRAPKAAGAERLLDSAVEDKELVVTVAPSDWNLPSRDALVGHGAVRVAIAPGHGPGGTLMVRPLKPGEVAPRGSTVAVLVTLELGGPLKTAR